MGHYSFAMMNARCPLALALSTAVVVVTGCLPVLTDPTYTPTEKLPGWCTSTETDADGAVTVSTRGWSQLASGWQVTTETLDFDDDGQLEGASSYAYDDDGKMLVEEFDNNVDGVFDFANERVYADPESDDAEVAAAPTNALVRIEVINLDTDAMTTLQRFVFDDDDAFDQPSAREVDYDVDGVNFAERFSYSDGRLAQTDFDFAADGSIEIITTYAYDGDLLSSVDVDTDADGNVDATNRYTYDDHGNVLEYVDNQYGRSTTYSYDCWSGVQL